MPKNAVQRLQKIENDIKTVISLYEVASKNTNNDKPQRSKTPNSEQLPQNSSPKFKETAAWFEKFRQVPGKAQTPFDSPAKKTGRLVAQPPKGVNSRESELGKKWILYKPGSAPSSSSAICESDYTRPQSSDARVSVEPGVLSKAKTSDNLNDSKCFDRNEFPVYNMVLSPSKTLETAKLILEKNCYNQNAACESDAKEDIKAEDKGTDVKHPRGQKQNKVWEVKNARSKNPAKEVKHSEREQNKNTEGKIRSPSPEDEISVEQIMECNKPVTPKTVVNSQQKSLVETHPNIYVCLDEESKTKKTTLSGGQEKEKQAFCKHVCFKSDVDVRDNNENINSKARSTLPKQSTIVVKNEEKCVVGDKREEKKNILNRDKIVQFSHISGGVRNSQNKIQKPAAQNEDTEDWVNDLSKIIERSNEKIEKMKVSKELALDIANHFKEKYDKIQKSKAKLYDKLMMTEKDNERLNTEMMEAVERKARLQHKVEGLQEDTTEATKEELQQQNIREENVRLRSKLCEIEKQYKVQILEEKKKTDEIEMNRMLEYRSELKHQEILVRKIQQLSKEKSDFKSKIDELRRQVQNGQTKSQTLEENIRRLEEEVQKQKQHLKIKTETVHETNRELEMIRLNCTELEEQVKMLRKNMEEIDGIQHSLIKKTTEYEHQIKVNQEKIRELQDENALLKGQLEEEKDGLRIKVKIIEDQQQTIRHLKEKSEDAKTLLKKNQSLERVLNIEREEKLELQEAVERLKWRKEELKKKVRTLEKDFSLAPEAVVRDLQKTQIVLHELENQVQMKQKEWELQLHSLIKEKEQACSVAEFATKKLMETKIEFQRQSEAYKGLQRLVAGNLAAKEKYMREGSKRPKVDYKKRAIVCSNV